MQSDNAVSIRFSDEFEQELYRLSKRFRNIRSDVKPIIEQLSCYVYNLHNKGGQDAHPTTMLKKY